MDALHGLRSVAVARQTVPENQQIKSSGGPWEFVGGLPLFDPPLHDSAYTIRRASDIGVNINDHWLISIYILLSLTSIFLMLYWFYYR